MIIYNIKGGDWMIKVNLKNLLKERDITLSELSKETGITMKTLSSFQNQRVESVQFNTLEQITYALNVSIEDILIKVVENFELSISFETSFSPNDNGGAFVIFWKSEDKTYTAPVYFNLMKSCHNNFNKYEFTINKIDYSLPKNIFSMPEIAKQYFDRTNSLINENSFLELISYLLIQEFIFISNEKFSYFDEFKVNVKEIVEIYSRVDIGKDEARYNNVGNVFKNNTLEYFVYLTALNNQLHLKHNNISLQDDLNANIESLDNLPFVSLISINEKTFKRKVFTQFD